MKKENKNEVYYQRSWHYHYPLLKISPPEKCPVLQSLFLIFLFSFSIFASIISKYSLLSICLSSFHFFQFLSNLFKYSSSNFWSSHPYNNFAIYFPGNSILLYSSTSPSCLLTSTPPRSNSSINSSAFFKFSLLSQVSPSAVKPFHYIKYFTTPLVFFLFSIFSTFHSSTSSISTGFPSSFFCPFTCSLYLTIWLTFTTRWILIELGNRNFTALVDTTSSITYSPTVRYGSHQGESPQSGLGDEQTLWNDLGFSLCAVPPICCMVTTSDEGEKVWVEVNTEWCVAIEHQRLSSIRDYLYQLSD